MSRKEKKKTGYNQREVRIFVNNAFMAAIGCEEMAQLSPRRAQKLREYSLALVKPALEHMEEGLLSRMELVSVLLSATLFVLLSGSEDRSSCKLPALQPASMLFRDSE